MDAPVTMLRVYCSWPGRVGDDELAPRRVEVAVGHVDRDALLALGAQAVGEQREVRRSRRRAGATCAPTCSSWSSKIDLVSNSSRPISVRLAVVHRARGGEADELGRAERRRVAVGARRQGQKYPSFLRSSMAASETRSSARVSPRSVIRVAAISATTSSSVAALGAHRAGAAHVADGAEAHGLARTAPRRRAARR